ncbi:GFA family protein [Vibrio hannami]|uniref:GFA family protein n=1 Tax=Vibrio hannami TaxID=2717094 RepID=UPI00240F70E4|nr:GFA family protein [Vibrio hannami]MDG3085411.1 GFA family protein [Vibrio hannami]
MSKIRTATCSCKLVTLTCKGEPIRTSACHCFECQKRTGSVFGVQARFYKEQVSIEGDVSSYTRVADSGNEVSYNFCPSCGTTLLLKLSAAPGHSIIPLGIFSEQDFPAPTFSVYEERKHGWVAFDCEVEHYD